jgi:hypothetical protein
MTILFFLHVTWLESAAFEDTTDPTEEFSAAICIAWDETLSAFALTEVVRAERNINLNKKITGIVAQQKLFNTSYLVGLHSIYWYCGCNSWI